MDSIDIREIDYVLAVYEERSFTRAAERCYVAQPALSKTVKKVEAKLGVEIFDRSTQPPGVTREGETVLDYLRRMRALHIELENYCSRQRTAEEYDLTVTGSTHFCTYVLPGVIDSFHAEHPDFRVRMLESATPEIRENIFSGQADIGISVELHGIRDLAVEHLSDERLLLAVPGDLAINERLKDYSITREALLNHGGICENAPGVPLQEFADEPFIMLKSGNDMRERAVRVCRAAGFYPRISLEMGQMFSSYIAAAAGRGVTFVRSSIPRFTGARENLVFYRVAHPDMVRHIYLLRSRVQGLTAEQQQFVNRLRQYFAETAM